MKWNKLMKSSEWVTIVFSDENHKHVGLYSCDIRTFNRMLRRNYQIVNEIYYHNEIKPGLDITPRTHRPLFPTSHYNPNHKKYEEILKRRKRK